MGDGIGIGEFGEACGLRGPWGASAAPGDRPGGPPCALGGPFALIGRDPRADLALDHPEVDRAHAYIQVVGGRTFCVDLGSRGGTHWADGPRPMGWVGPGETIGVGPYRVTLHAPGAPGDGPGRDAPPTSRSYLQDGPVEASLEFLDSAAEQRSWRVSRSLVLVGRSPACKVRLGSAGFHCGLVRTPMGLWVVDLLGRAGTLVNGRPRRASKLNDGDLLRIVDQEIRVRLGPADALPARRPATILTMPAAPTPAVDPVALLREFGLMQQQMADQFQQALLMMFQMFSGMHQEQMGLIREEMARLHQLSQEQVTLQARLADRPEPPPRPPRPAPDEAPRPSVDADPYRLHADLVGRLASIQQERQTGWQRLIGTLTSRGERPNGPAGGVGP